MRRRSGYNSKEFLCFLTESSRNLLDSVMSKQRSGLRISALNQNQKKGGQRKMAIVCFAGVFAVFFLLAWTLCRAAGWEKEWEDLEQEQYLKEWCEKKLKKIEKF